MLPERISAIIIENKKLLLVTGYEEKFYWTPGGKIEGKESHEKCLKRELLDELGIKLIKMKHYATLNLINEIKKENQINHYYIVEYTGKIKPKNEITKFIWYSKTNFLDKKPRVSKGIETDLIPRLLGDNFL